jgi:hypothetical protein
MGDALVDEWSQSQSELKSHGFKCLGVFDAGFEASQTGTGFDCFKPSFAVFRQLRLMGS